MFLQYQLILNGFAPGLVLKQRQKATRKWPQFIVQICFDVAREGVGLNLLSRIQLNPAISSSNPFPLDSPLLFLVIYYRLSRTPAI